MLEHRRAAVERHASRRRTRSSPRTAGSATASGALAAPRSARRESRETRRSDTRTVARFAYMPISACSGGRTRIWYAMNATKVPTVIVAVDHAQAAVDEHRAGAGRQDQAGQAARQIGQPLHRHQRAHERGVALAEPRDLALLRVRRRRPAASPAAFRSGSCRCRRCAAAAPRPRLRAARDSAPAPTGRAAQSRRVTRNSRTSSHASIADRADEEQHVADPGERGLRGDALDLADVVVDARHDVAEPRARVEARRQPLQVAVHLQPHVEQDVGRHARVAKAADDVQRRS